VTLSIHIQHNDIKNNGAQNQGEPKFLQKVAKAVAKPKNAKIPTSKLNLKVRNIYIKPFVKPENTYKNHTLKLLI
jgi:hypothetical protein